MLSKDKIDDKDLVIARLKGIIAEMATFISHFDFFNNKKFLFPL